MSDIDLSDLISYSEGGRILEVSRPTIYAMIDRKELNSIPVADRRYLSKKACEELKKKKATAGEP